MKNNISNFYMMIGIVGSGKSTIAKRVAVENNATIIESDAYRQDEYGDASVQGDNHSLFEKMHNDIISLLSVGKNVILDATNISHKHRVAFLSKLNRLDVHKTAILCMTDVSTCIEQNNARERKVPEHVIIRMWKTFNVPVYAEGWDSIVIEYNYKKGEYVLSEFMKNILGFEQDNPHHSMSLGKHCTAVADSLNGVRYSGRDLYIAGLLHDNGKVHTKVFTDVHGNPTSMAHYYQHAEVGAYESILFLNSMGIYSTDDILFYAGVILYHMRPYQLKSQKSIDKLRNTIGIEMFNAVMALNKEDIEAH